MRQLEPGLTTDLTARQEEVLDFIEDFITREKMPPTRAEICAHFGWKSWNAAEQVVPLQGKNVCGLHVETNLRITTKVENMRKSNKHE
jgi:SOS-response transcriptional repressor LexA